MTGRKAHVRLSRDALPRVNAPTAAAAVAGPPMRHMATTGGNLCLDTRRVLSIHPTCGGRRWGSAAEWTGRSASSWSEGKNVSLLPSTIPRRCC